MTSTTQVQEKDNGGHVQWLSNRIPWASVHHSLLLNIFHIFHDGILIRFRLATGPERINVRESASSLSKTWKDRTSIREPGVMNTPRTYRNFTLRVDQTFKQFLSLCGTAILALWYARVTTNRRQRLGNREIRSALNRSEWIRDRSRTLARRTPRHRGLCPITLGHGECRV
jgi:hypothetical protein